MTKTEFDTMTEEKKYMRKIEKIMRDEVVYTETISKLQKLVRKFSKGRSLNSYEQNYLVEQIYRKYSAWGGE